MCFCRTVETVAADVLMENGVISRIDRNLDADIRIDAGGCMVLPGLIDIHTHGTGRVSTDEGTHSKNTPG